MELRFFIDADTSRPHFERHGVVEDQVLAVLRRPDEVQPAQEGAKAATKKLYEGPTIRVIYRDLPEQIRFVITAYALRGRALEAFRRRRGKNR